MSRHCSRDKDAVPFRDCCTAGCLLLGSDREWRVMQVNVELPEDVSEALLRHWGNLPRGTLEAIAIDGYRSGALTESQVRRLLGFETRIQVHEFLKNAGVYLNYTLDDLNSDIETQRRLGI